MLPAEFSLGQFRVPETGQFKVPVAATHSIRLGGGGFIFSDRPTQHSHALFASVVRRAEARLRLLPARSGPRPHGLGRSPGRSFRFGFCRLTLAGPPNPPCGVGSTTPGGGGFIFSDRPTQHSHALFESVLLPDLIGLCQDYPKPKASALGARRADELSLRLLPARPGGPTESALWSWKHHSWRRRIHL